MRCSCRACGTYMVQEEYGLQSGCKCPDCGNMCRDCMGSAREPMSKEELAGCFAFQTVGISAKDKDVDEAQNDENEAHVNWRKFL